MDVRDYTANSVLDFRADIMALTANPLLATAHPDGTFTGTLRGRRVLLLDEAAIDALDAQAKNCHKWSKVLLVVALVSHLVLGIIATFLPPIIPLGSAAFFGGLWILTGLVPYAISVYKEDLAIKTETRYHEQQALKIMSSVSTGRVPAINWKYGDQEVATPALVPANPKTIAKVLLQHTSKQNVYPDAVARFVAPYIPVPA